MPLLAGLLGNAFVAVVTWLGSFVSRKLAVGGALAAFLIAGWIALQAGLHGLVTAISFVMPSFLVEPLGLVSYLLPSNFSACVQAIALAYVGRWLWDAQREWGRALAAV